MSFESRVLAFAERYLSARTSQLIVAPALADLEFERGAGPIERTANRLAVLKAVAGGLRDDVSREAGSFVTLTLLPTCYYVLPLSLCFDVFSTWTGFLAMAMVVFVLSLGPVMVCFWPERQPSRPAD